MNKFVIRRSTDKVIRLLKIHTCTTSVKFILQRLHRSTERDPNSSQGSQLPLQPQVDTEGKVDQGKVDIIIPDAGTPVQRPPRATQTDPNSSQASQLALKPQVNTDQSSGQSRHIPHAGTPVQRLPRATETDPNSSQASQLPLQPQVNTDQNPWQSGHIPEAGTCFQDLFHVEKIGTFSLRVLSVYLIFHSCDMKIIAPKEKHLLDPLLQCPCDMMATTYFMSM